MSGGWIKLHRKILESPVFDDPQIFRLWVLCLMKAAHKPVTQSVGSQLVHLEPGQFVTGRDALADEYNSRIKNRESKVSSRTIWRWMKMLEKWGNLSISSSSKYSVVTIVNWAFYQSEEGENVQQDVQQNVQQVSSSCPADVQEVSTNKNVRNKEIYTTTATTIGDGPTFADLANTYFRAFGRHMSAIQLDEINHLIDKEGLPVDLLIYGIEKAGRAGQNFAYATGIFRSWLNKGIRTLDAALDEEAKRQIRRDELEVKRREKKLRQMSLVAKKPRYTVEEMGW